MKVKELIATLSTANPDADIRICIAHPTDSTRTEIFSIADIETMDGDLIVRCNYERDTH